MRNQNSISEDFAKDLKIGCLPNLICSDYFVLLCSIGRMVPCQKSKLNARGSY